MPHISLLILKGYFKSLSEIYTAPVPIVLSIDIPTEMESSFLRKICKFWFKNSIMYCPQKPVTKFILPS
jgi:hypothetical protein